jgi:DNA-binding NtrC family response regulator
MQSYKSSMNKMSITNEQGSYCHYKTLEDTQRIEALTRGPSTQKSLSYSPRILVVDDETVIRTMIKRSLELQLKADIVLASNGLMASEFIAQDSFDLIISDMQMPLMTGLDLYEWTRIHSPQMTDHFFIISGDLGSVTAAEELNRYGVQVVRKPFLMGTLMNTVIQHLPMERSAEFISV